MTRLARALGGSVFLALVLAALIVPVYAVALLALLGLPPLLAGVVIAGKAPAGQSRPHLLFLALGALPLALLAFLAPVRSLLVAGFTAHPPALRAFHEAHAPLYGALEAWLGPDAVAAVDTALGLYGAATILVLAILASARRNLLARQVDNLATARARSVALGLAELKGRAVPCDGDASKPLIRTWYERRGEGHAEHTDIRPFYLDDGTGRILVDARGAELGARASLFSIALHQVSLQVRPGALGLPEAQLLPGDTVYLVGRVQVNPGAPPADARIVRPQRLSPWRLDQHDLFFLAQGDERTLARDLRASIARGWYGVALLMAASLWLSINAWTSLLQARALRLDAPPPLFRLLAVPTPLERPLEIEGETKRALYWIEDVTLRGQARPAVLEALEREGLVRHAAPALQAFAAAIDHPAFGVANAWLARTRQHPRERWGAEYFVAAVAQRGDTALMRLALELRGGQLYASWRAHFGRHSGVRAYRVVLELTPLPDGPPRRIEFPAAPGPSSGDGVLAFAAFAPGRYRVTAYPMRQYQDALHDRGLPAGPDPEIELAPP